MRKNVFPIEVLSIYGQAFCARQANLIKNAQCIFGGRAIIAQVFPEYEQGKCHSDKEFYNIGSPLANTFELIEKLRNKGKKILVLAHGDALYFGIGKSLIDYFGNEAVQVHAGISILQNLCARLGIASHNVASVSLHGRNNAKSWQNLASAIFTAKPVCVLTDANSSPSAIAKFLLSRGASKLQLHIAENLGQDDEKLYTLSLNNAVKHTYNIKASCTVLLVPTKDFTRPMLGLNEAEILREKNLMTKPHVRASALSLMQIKPHHTIWDIGAGSGAVSLEMCSLAYAGQVIAVEKNVKRLKHIEKNRKYFGAVILDICAGSAPTCLKELAKPDRIFVGGGLSADNAEELLQTLCNALPAKGRMVISCVLLGSMYKAEAFLKKQGFNVQVLQLNAYNSAELADDIRLVPENPVFLIAAEKT